MSTRTTRPTYIIRLRPKPKIDAIVALRAALKILRRRFGLQAIEVREERKK
jgi:hypothetical protein